MLVLLTGGSSFSDASIVADGARCVRQGIHSQHTEAAVSAVAMNQSAIGGPNARPKGSGLSRTARPAAGVASLAAYHSGPEFETEERGCWISCSCSTPQDHLGLLILADMIAGPSGKRTSRDARIDESLTRPNPNTRCIAW